MATANLRYRKNGGSLLSAASTAVAEDVISMTATSFAGWTSGRFEIRTYPDGFACPAGWSTDASTGAYYYLSSSMTGTTPPDFTLPDAADITAGQWGKFEFRLTVNDTIVSTATGVEIVGPNGTHDLAFGEGSEFGGPNRSWVGPHQDNLRLFDNALAGGAVASAHYVTDASSAVNANDVPLRAMTGTLAFLSSALPISSGRSGVAASDVEAFRVRRTVTDGGGLGTSSTALRIALAMPNGAGTETDVAEIGAQLTSAVGPVSKLVLRTMTGGTLADALTLSGAGLVRLHGSAYASAGGRFVTDGSGNVTLAAISEAELRTAAAALTTSLNVNAQKITNLGTPTLATDAATKSYVDAISSGLDIKASVRAATTANITLSGPQTIDTVSIIAGDRVLVKDQSTGADRGIYLCAAGAWTRTTDLAAGASAAGAFCFVEEGTANVDKGFVCTTNAGSDVVGTDALAFTQFTGVGSGADATTHFLTDASSAINANDIPVRALASTLGIAGAANVVPLSLTFLAATGSGASGYSAEVRRALTSGVGTTGTWVGVKFTLPDYNTGADIAAATARVEATSGLGTTIVTKYVLAVSNGAGPVDMFTLAGSGAVRMHLYTAGRALFDGSGNITSTAITAAEVQTACATLASSLAVNSQKITGLAAGSGSGEAVEFGQLAGYATTTTTLTAGAGLTGGGDLSTGRTFNVAAADASITVNADSIEASGAFVAKNISTTGTLTAGAAGVTNTVTGLLVERYDAIGAADTIGLVLRNNTSLVSTGEQRPPLLAWEGHGWNTSAGGSDELDVLVFQPTLTAASGGPKIELRPRYNRNGGAYGGLGGYWTTQDSGLFGLAFVVGTLIVDASGNGVRFIGDGNGGMKKNSTHVMLTSGGSNNVQLGTNGTVRWDMASTGAVVQSFDATATSRAQWSTAGINYTDTAKRAVTTTSATPENGITFAMPDNSAAMFEVKVYCYIIANPAARAYFHWRGYVNRNGGAPTLDNASAISTDVIVGGWGSPPAITIAAGAPTTNDVSLQLTAPGTDPIRWVVTKYEINVCTTAA